MRFLTFLACHRTSRCSSVATNLATSVASTPGSMPRSMGLVMLILAFASCPRCERGGRLPRPYLCRTEDQLRVNPNSQCATQGARSCGIKSDGALELAFLFEKYTLRLLLWLRVLDPQAPNCRIIASANQQWAMGNAWLAGAAEMIVAGPTMEGGRGWGWSGRVIR